MSSVFTIYRLEKIDQTEPSLPFIGCTRDLETRIIRHRTDFAKYPSRLVYKTVSQNGGWGAWRFQVIAHIHEDSHEPGVAKQMAAKLESDLIRALIPKVGCSNAILPMRPKDEQYEREKKRLRDLYHNDPKYKAHSLIKANWRYLTETEKLKGYARDRYHRLQAEKASVNASLEIPTAHSV
jgi:hypothetical protein